MKNESTVKWLTKLSLPMNDLQVKWHFLYHLIVLLFFIFYVTSFGSLHLYKSIIILAILTYGLAHFTCISPTHKSQGLMLENMTRLMTWWSRQISFLLSSLRLSILIIKKNVKESRINCLKLKNKQVTRISTIYSRLYSLSFFFFFFWRNHV